MTASFPARFDSGTCIRCKQPIRQGDVIQRVPGHGFEHVACQSVPELRGNPPASPSRAKWSAYKGKTVTVRRGSREVTGKIYHETRINRMTGESGGDRWYLSLGYAGYEGSTYWRGFDLRAGDEIVSVEAQS
jgi:hypothetical protein